MRLTKVKNCRVTLNGNWLMVAVLCLAGLAARPARGADAAGASNSVVAQLVQLERGRILGQADRALTVPPPAITDHLATNSTGGPHDFFSQADYCWPDPKPGHPAGLPYVMRDGFINPDRFNDHRLALLGMRDAVSALAAAYALTGDDRYVTKAAEFLRVFFLDDRTRMNPNLEHAQAVLGVSPGMYYGIIDALHLAEVPVAVRFLEKSPAFPPAVDQGLKRWFADYLQWLTTSENGRKEMNTGNNHGVAAYLQLACFAKFTSDRRLLALARQHYRDILLPEQMAPNGSFPYELARSRPYGYSVFQMQNLATLAWLLSASGEDEWNYTRPDGRNLGKALAFLYPYLADKNRWLADHRRKDVTYWEALPVRQPFLIFASLATGDEKYFDLWKTMKPASDDLEIRRGLAVTQPLLWVTDPAQTPLLKP